MLLVYTLRKNNIKCFYDFKNRNFSKKLKDALNTNSKYIIFIKDNEVKNKTLIIKDSLKKEQITIKKDNLLDFLKEKKYV